MIMQILNDGCIIRGCFSVFKLGFFFYQTLLSIVIFIGFEIVFCQITTFNCSNRNCQIALSNPDFNIFSEYLQRLIRFLISSYAFFCQTRTYGHYGIFCQTFTSFFCQIRRFICLYSFQLFIVSNFSLIDSICQARRL